MRSLLFASALIAAGCTTSTEEKRPTPSFSIETKKSVELRHGESQSLDVTVTWEKSERKDLELSATVEPPDRGVTAEAEPASVRRDAKGPPRVRVRVSETAVAGEYTLTITVRAKGMAPATAAVAVRVPRKE